MAKIYQIPFSIPNTIGIIPNFKFMVCYDNISAITTPGYLTPDTLQSFSITTTDILQIFYNFNIVTNVGNYGIFTVSINDNLITLNPWINPANVLLPVVNGDVAIFNGTTGQVSDSNILASNLMSINSINNLTPSGRIVSAKVNGTEASNAVTANGMSGVITTSSLTTVGGSNYPITWTNSFISTSSTILVGISGGTNTNQNITINSVPGSGTSTLTIYNNAASTALNGTIKISYFVI